MTTEEEPPYVWHFVTCQTDGCSVENVTYRVKLYVNADGIFRAQCGQCGGIPAIVEDEVQTP